MNLFRNTPIRRRITALNLITCVAALLLVGIALFAVQLFTARQNFSANLRTIAEIIETNVTAAVTFNDAAAATEILSSLKARDAVTYASIELLDGSILASYDSGLAQGGVAGKATGLPIQPNYTSKVFSQPIRLDGETIGLLYLQADYGSELRRLILIYGAVLITVLTLATGLAFLLSRRLRSSIADPIMALAGAARAVVQNNDYSVRAQKFDHNELGTLTDGFNQMLEHIEAQSAALQEGRDLLEVRVIERTAMLQTANVELTVATQEAAAANLAKSEFLSRMSHELRTPMNAILGFSQLLEIRRDLNATQSNHVGQILNAGRHLLDLIDEVLDISRIESGHMSLSLEAVQVEMLVQETIDLMRPLAKQLEVELVQASFSAEAHVFADRQRFKQTLLNLLSNAIKYNHTGGRVVVDCQSSAPGLPAADGLPATADFFRIGVTDTGVGIPAEKLQRLFTPFDRLDAERTEVQGTGLGLSLSKKMTELMGGTLAVESVTGRGSTFSINLPMAECPLRKLRERGAFSPDSIVPSRTQSIVYIEDNLSNLRVVEATLGLRAGVKVYAAMQGALGIDLVREHLPDLVLLDLNLPDLSGLDVLSRLRRDPRTRAVPVLMVTADATQGQKQRLMDAGASGYVTKPLDIPEFLKVVDEMLARKASAYAVVPALSLQEMT